MKETKSIKIKAIAKIDELKKWVYKHFIGVYIGIGVAICLLMLILGVVIGQAIARPVQPSEYETHAVSADKALTSNTSATNNIELVFRSSYE